MNDTTVLTSPTLARPPSSTQRLPVAARSVLGLLERLPHGHLHLQLPDGSVRHFGRDTSAQAPQASLRLHDGSPLAAALAEGDIGFARSYIEGGWDTPDLSALLRLLLANREALERLVYGSWWGGLAHRLRHALNRNSRSGSRRNIHLHYDLGNHFYRSWLDETMNYSSAWFEGDLDRPLAQAQQAKMRRALTEAGVGPGSRVLEIGCGWGAVAEVAARDLDAQLTGVTLSSEQLNWGQQRLARAGLAERADLRLQDYRDITDPAFDAIVSIEMFEAVGEAQWPTYFRQVQRLLKPGARACIQTITIRDDLFDRYRRSSDFIQQYIFPGGMLPCDAAFRREAERAGLVVERAFGFGRDYAETLRRWRVAFDAQRTAVQRLGFDATFQRTWEFYLAYCEAAFDTGNTDVVQYTLRRAA
ncbi:SAM-dependent methyltransferase [Sphaerotilus microaerophilus]|uniref:Cyclopropane-fatty-acyl-phospholipid synthase n=1 Tax=Sphaerotilus microaerophilus TaxID=2914710 RepID=A0ABN6PGN3_9BURK|nr:cyclopropane-fatty-acyl-phospholipid synthase family protein [Sphaerotilus sp. FB-5]BDI04171.1 cyclopropane-fatty-acyl-phospholipid synthase [Sphaerotilus sp. FB-5]